MSKTQVRVLLSCCLVAAAIVCWAQGVTKPGLWSMTSTTTWQKTPLPPGMNLPPGVPNPFGPTTHTMDVCLTQEMIDKYGAPMAGQQPGENCTVSNVVRKPGGMSAEMTCTGKMTAHATVVSSWSGTDSSHSIVHFTGTMQMGPNPLPVEFTVDSTSTFKGADCGSVKPMQLPASK